MEVPGRRFNNPLSDSKTTDLELSCDPCSIKGNQLAAVGFCIDCQQYLCETCYRYHCLPMPTQNHKLLDRNAMPHKKTLIKSESTCPHHDGKAIKYFCKSSDQFGCSVCMTTSHRSCDDVEYIRDIARKIDEHPEYKELTKQLQDMKEKFEKNDCKTKDNRVSAQFFCSRAKEDIELLRKEINVVFDKLVSEIENEAQRIEHDEVTKLNSVSEVCQTALQEVQTLRCDIEMLLRTNQTTQLFIMVKKAGKRMQSLDERLKEVEKDNKIMRYMFVPNKRIHKFMDSCKEFGMLKKTEDVKATHVQTINVKSPFDEGNCAITGSALMAGGRLVLADYKNKCVKVVDTKITNIITMPVYLLSRPWDITVINKEDNATQDEVAVTLPNVKAIQFFRVLDVFRKNRMLAVSGECRGIVSYSEKLAVTFTSPPKVEVIKLDGIVLRTISTAADGILMFDCPYYVAVSPDKTSLFVTDFFRYTVTRVSTAGAMQAVCKYDKELDMPTGVIANKDDTVHVCRFVSGDVHQITSNCDKLQVLLKETDGVARPWSITHNERTCQFYIGMEDCNQLQVFELK